VREIKSIYRTLPQILYHKDEIIKILIKHLRVHESLAYEPLLDLATKLARDLEDDFYPYFGEVIGCIIELTKYKDVEILEVRTIY
jgi:U3 small nucleolar RNA-associated protein 20